MMPSRARGFGVPGVSELPSLVAVEIAQDVPSPPRPAAAEVKPIVATGAPGQRRRMARLIEIELAGGRRVRVDRGVMRRR